MKNTQYAFTLASTMREELFIDLADVVDQLDHLRMVVDGAIHEPEADRDLEAVIERGISYLRFLYDTVASNDILNVSTLSLEESSTRRRIARLLRRGSMGAQL